MEWAQHVYSYMQGDSIVSWRHGLMKESPPCSCTSWGTGVSLVAVTKEERPGASFPILTLPCFASINIACSLLGRIRRMVLTKMGAGEVGVQMDMWCVVNVLATASHFSAQTLLKTPNAHAFFLSFCIHSLHFWYWAMDMQLGLHLQSWGGSWLSGCFEIPMPWSGCLILSARYGFDFHLRRIFWLGIEF